jgi:hypothetical protein
LCHIIKTFLRSFSVRFMIYTFFRIYLLAYLLIVLSSSVMIGRDFTVYYLTFWIYYVWIFVFNIQESSVLNWPIVRIICIHFKVCNILKVFMVIIYIWVDCGHLRVSLSCQWICFEIRLAFVVNLMIFHA